MLSLNSTKVALTIESRALRLLVVKNGAVHSWMTVPLSSDVFDNEAVAAPRPFQALLTSLFFQREHLRSQAMVCIPGTRAFYRTVSLPKLKRQLLKEALWREAKQQLPVEREQLHLFWQPFRVSKDGAEFLLVATQRESYDQFFGVLQKARMRPRLWELKPLALVRAVGKGHVLILDLDEDGSTLLLVSDGVPRLVRSVAEPPGGTSEERGQRLAEQAARTVEYYESTQAKESWDVKTPVVFTGPYAAHTPIIEAFSGKSKWKVEPFRSPAQCPSDFPAATYATALGLALKRGHTNPKMGNATAVDFNACPEQYRGVQVQPKQVAAGMGLALGVALLLPLGQTARGHVANIESRQAQLSVLQHRVAIAKEDLLKRGQAQQEIDQVAAQVKALQGERGTILSGSDGTSEDLRAVYEALPPGVKLDRLSRVDQVVVLDGTAPDYGGVLAYARSLEAQPRFQDAVVTSLGQKSTTAQAPPSATFTLAVTRRSTQ